MSYSIHVIRDVVLSVDATNGNDIYFKRTWTNDGALGEGHSPYDDNWKMCHLYTLW